MKKTVLSILVGILCLTGVALADNDVTIDGYSRKKVDILEFNAIPEPGTAPSNKGRIYMDSTAGELYKSEDGGAYEVLGSGGGSSPWTSTTDGAYLNGDATISGAYESATIKTTGQATFIGDVGIGLSSPVVELEINDTSNTQVILRETDGDVFLKFGAGDFSEWYAMMTRSTASGALQFREDGSDVRMVLGNGGNVGIGPDTTPDEFFDVQGAMIIDSDLTVGNNDLYINTDLTRVGVGTTNPSYNLDMADGSIGNVNELLFSEQGQITGLSSLDDTSLNNIEPLIDHDNLLKFDPNEHVNWTEGGGATEDFETSGDLSIGNTATVNGNLYVGNSLFFSGTALEFPTDVTVTGNLNAGVDTRSLSGNHTATVAEVRGTIIYQSGSASTITLPAIADGYNVIVKTIGDIAIAVDPNASDKIWLDGTALDDGDKIWNLTTSGNTAVLTYYSGDGWYASTDGWVDGGA